MKRIHFIAIGGAVMHQLALALLRQGNVVSGSDDEINDPAKAIWRQQAYYHRHMAGFRKR